MAAHRASALLEILPNALETGFSKVAPELEPLKVSVKPKIALRQTEIFTEYPRISMLTL
jgi:hypothetical protein